VRVYSWPVYFCLVAFLVTLGWISPVSLGLTYSVAPVIFLQHTCAAQNVVRLTRCDEVLNELLRRAMVFGKCKTAFG